MFKRLRSLFRVLTRRREFEDGITEELRFHIDQYADELVRSGMSPGKAARLARVELGSLTNIKGDCREAFGVHLFDEFQRELSYAARLLRKTPGFTATALLTLAVCFGANLTIFAVIDSVSLAQRNATLPCEYLRIFSLLLGSARRSDALSQKRKPLLKPIMLPFFPTHFGGNDITPIPM